MKLNTEFNVLLASFSPRSFSELHVVSFRCDASSDVDELGCSALFQSALFSLITKSSPMSSRLLARVTSSLLS